MKKTKVLVMGLLLCLAQPMCSQGFGNLLKGVTTAVKETKKKSQKGNAEVTNQEEQVTKADDDITLVVSAVGTTTEEATKTALRSAIEQAYGTFVSANTTILNDELVKDEIVTVANGNIKAYKEIACNELADGRISVTLQAMVSISKLVSYAQSKGASTEFAGAAFAMNMKMKELNKKNEMAALENLLVQVKQMLPYALNRELTVDTPKEIADYTKKALTSSRMLNSIVMNDGAKENLDNFIQNISNYYQMTISIQLKENENFDALFNLFHNTLNSLMITEEERKEMKMQNIKYGTLYRISNEYYLRNSDENLREWQKKMDEVIINELFNFVFIDNLGGKSYLDDEDLLDVEHKYLYERRTGDGGDAVKGYGLFSPISIIYYHSNNEFKRREGTCFVFNNKLNLSKEGVLKISFFIPKDKIMEYNNFSLERKSN